MYYKVSILVLCLAFVGASAVYDYKYAFHNAIVTRSCPSVASGSCCLWAPPCAITYYMRYSRRTRVHACRSSSTCFTHCFRHFLECRRNCDAAMTYAERVRSFKDKCKCVTKMSFLTSARNSCRSMCSSRYSSCRSSCQSGPTCPINVNTNVYFRRTLEGRCAPVCTNGICFSTRAPRLSKAQCLASAPTVRPEVARPVTAGLSVSGGDVSPVEKDIAKEISIDHALEKNEKAEEK